MTTKEIDLVMGLGEIGSPICQILQKSGTTLGYDLDSRKMNTKRYNLYKDNPISFLHICIPFTKKFVTTVVKIAKQKKPKALVIHSTIEPYTTERIQKKLDIPIFYSATRGVHSRMIKDLKKYIKFYSVYNWAPNAKWAINLFNKKMKKAGIKTKKMSSPLTLELAKIIVDTSYYGWLINYAQLSNMIAIKHGIDYDEMWTFSDEIQKYLGNRPKMYPGFIGGHCVIPNLELIREKSLYEINKINNMYASKVKNLESIKKKYNKSKKSSYDSRKIK